MAFYTSKDSTTKYYQAPNSVLTWQGICPTNKHNEFVITGTAPSGFGAVYKGHADVLDTSLIQTAIFPNSTSTSVYGPEYIHHHKQDDKLNLVGSYQTGTPGITEPCVGFGYSGAYGDFANPNNYFTIEPDVPTKFTVVHSVREGLAVYVSSDVSGINLDEGKSYVFDIETKKTICEVRFPDSLHTTTYGIWFNGCVKHYDHYTIAGGFTAAPLDVRTFVVDFYYNRVTGLFDFEGWTEIKLPGITLFSHAQGISGLGPDLYVLPIANFYINPTTPDTLTEYTGGKIHVRRVTGTFVLVDYETINFPQATITSVTSAAKNVVVGICANTGGDVFSYQAVTH